MSTAQFVKMYHPSYPSTATEPARVAPQSVDEHFAKGWLLFDPNAAPPVTDTPYYTKEALLSQIQGGAAPVGTALRAASVAAVEAEATVAPTGAWDFTSTPKVAGVPVGTGGLSTKLYDSISQTYVASEVDFFVGPVDPEDTGVLPADVDAWWNTNPKGNRSGVLTHSGYWSCTPHAARTTTALAQDELVMGRLILPRPMEIGQFAVDVTVAAAGSTIEVVLGRNDPTDSPVEILHVETVSGATVSTAVLSAVFSEPVEPDTFWLGLCARGGAPTVRSVTTSGSLGLVPQENPGGTTVFNSLRYKTGGAAIPANIPALNNNTVLWSSALPIVWFKVA